MCYTQQFAKFIDKFQLQYLITHRMPSLKLFLVTLADKTMCLKKIIVLLAPIIYIHVIRSSCFNGMVSYFGINLFKELLFFHIMTEDFDIEFYGWHITSILKLSNSKSIEIT